MRRLADRDAAGPEGYRVLLVDRARFPSDTLSTHVIHAPGVSALSRWGLLDRVRATGCPPIAQYSFDFGPFTIAGTPRPVDGFSSAYAPRRTVLDKILVGASADAGAEVREHFNVDEIVMDGGGAVGIRGHDEGGTSVFEHARVVIGADGRNSHVAKAVDAFQYNEKPRLQWSYYTYWSVLTTSAGSSRRLARVWISCKRHSITTFGAADGTAEGRAVDTSCSH